MTLAFNVHTVSDMLTEICAQQTRYKGHWATQEGARPQREGPRLEVDT